MATKIWKKFSHFVLTYLSYLQKKVGFFQILWPSCNIWTLMIKNIKVFLVLCQLPFACCHIHRIWRIWCLIQIHIWVKKNSLSIFWTLLHTLWLWMDKVVSSSMSWPTNSLQFILPWSPHSVTLTILIRKITTFRHPKWKKFATMIQVNQKIVLVFFIIFWES